VFAALSLGAGSALASPPAPEPYGTNDYGGFRNILPPGQNGFTTAADYLTGSRPLHNNDQWNMYGDLATKVGKIDDTVVDNSYKDATFGVPAGHVADTYTPNCAIVSAPSANSPHCDDVTIVRDTDYGVPHIYGADRAGALFGSGYAAAEDRLFFMDVERHLGRGTMASFLGGSNAASDRGNFASAPYSEADLQAQYDNLDDSLGQDGEQGQKDVQNYIDGINQYIAEARQGPAWDQPGTMIPGEYGLATNSPAGPDAWKVTDVVATATLVGGQFGKGGGSEINSALALNAAKAQFGDTDGRKVWEDFRQRESSDAPTTVHNGMNFPYGTSPDENTGTVALPDPGTLQDQPVVPAKQTKAQEPAHKPVMDDFFQNQHESSNALLVSDAQTTFDHPLAVFGPQVGYFSPEVLTEQDIHAPTSAEGPALDARGVGFAGVSLYVLLGHGDDYAWSATSASQDIIDNYAVQLCDPDNPDDPGAMDDDGYRYNGECLPFEEVTRTESWAPTPQDPTPAGSQTMTALRTKLGIVKKRAEVDGTPMAFTELRSTYMHDVDAASGFADYNSPDRVNSPATFEDAASKIGFTFNWFYIDDDHIAYYNSGDNPVRPDGVSGDLPVLTSPYDTLANAWEGFNPDTNTSDVTPFGAHPNVVDQNYISSWNNKQAPGFHATDGGWSYGSVHRVDSLNERIEKGIAGSNTMTRAELVNAMEDAATVDLRGSQDYGTVIQVIKQSGAKLSSAQKKAIKKLQEWIKKGAHRLDKDGDGAYENSAAIRIADAWWPRLNQAEFEPTLGTPLYSAIQAVVGLDDKAATRGSSYNNGWYSFVDKDLRTVLGEQVEDPFSRVYCGGGKLKKCGKALATSLTDALAHDSSDELYGTNTCTTSHGVTATPQWCANGIKPTTVGVWGQNQIQWQNRPTFQQVVEVQGHR
jgi:acyl-homoserine lactone acylase PvdQ